MMATSLKKTDVEVGESSPLIRNESTPSYDPESEPPPLEEMKENTLKERAVAGAAAVVCTY